MGTVEPPTGASARYDRCMRLTALVLAAALPLSTAAVQAEGGDHWLSRDKLQHYIAGAGLAAGGYAASSWVVSDRRGRLASGVAVGVGASAAKEWYDRSHAGTSSWRDFTWGALGAVTGATVAWLLSPACCS